MSINWSKTQYLIIGTDNMQSLDVTVDSHPIVSSDNLEILGVVIDKRLSFEQHIDKVVNKTLKILYAMKRVRYYLNDKSLKIIYKSLIESHFSYASPVWGFTYDTHINRLNCIQNRFMKFVNESYSDALHTCNSLSIPNLMLYHSFLFIYRSVNHLKLNNFFL